MQLMTFLSFFPSFLMVRFLFFPAQKKKKNSFLSPLSCTFFRDGASDFVGMRSHGDGGKMEVLVRVVEKADQLRLKTIEKLVELFTPRQAAEFLIAAAHLQFGVRALGATYDRRL
ncbi:unnamed protein product [Coffea canephora]|uniref:DOG1 domain-containing protein n=1 Tax=Coffea canephora TaxID=49390 RepID=A0A068UBZ2_COFCA|nr:unnamed protein product [Coffea canephora]